MSKDDLDRTPQPDRAGGAPATPEPLRPAEMKDAALKSRTRRDFIIAAVAAAAGGGLWQWVRTRGEADGALWPLRRVFQFNEGVAQTLFTDAGRAKELPAGSAQGPPRLNSNIGAQGEVDADAYRLNVIGLAAGDGTASLTLDDVHSLPKTEMTSQLCCVEGWSTFGNWGGVRLVDFLKAHPPKTKSGKPWVVGETGDLPNYVSMATPSGGYYVGLDVASALHPQTMLCYEIDRRPLSVQHGAPLRLVIPTKYGIKNLKRVGAIELTDTRPGDYWAERGYDWYAGL